MNVATSIIVCLPDDQEGNTVLFQHSESYWTIKAALQDDLKEMISCSVGIFFLDQPQPARETSAFLFYFFRERQRQKVSPHV